MPRRRARLAFLAVAVIAAAAPVGVTLAAFSNATTTAGSFSAAPDWIAPTVNASDVANAAGGMSTSYSSAVLADNPIAYWRLGEGSGTSAADASGNGNSGTYANGVTLGAAPGVHGTATAASFDGVNDEVDVPHAAVLNLNAGAFTIEFWGRQTAFANTNPGIVDKGSAATADGWQVTYNSSGTLSFKRNNKAVASSSGAFSGTAWKHFVVTWDGTTVRWYVNGALDTSGAQSFATDNSTAQLTIGLGDAGQYGNERLDDVAVYGTALSAPRVAAHYDAGKGAYVVRQCGRYYAYADDADGVSNPASGIASVTGDLSSVSSGQTAATLSAGSFQVAGSSYNYRTAPLTASAASGSYSYSLTSTDNASNSRTQSGYGATVDTNAAPTPVELTGFEGGAPSASGFSAVTSGVTADGSLSRHGGYSLRVAPSGAAADADWTLPSSQSYAVARLVVRLAALPSATVALASVNAAAGNAATLVYDQASGKLGVRWGTGSITDGTVSVSAGTWYVVELRVGFGTNPRVLDWRVDGIVQPQISSAETASTGTTFRLGSASASTFTANYDDVVVSQKPGDYPIGDGGVLALRPDGMGTSSTGGKLFNQDGTAIAATTWNRLDDDPMTPITDGVKQTATGTANYVELTFQDTTQSCINGVSAAFSYHSSAAGANTGETRVLDGATSTTVYSGTLGSAAVAYKQAMVTAASSPWTQSAVNGLKARVGFSSDIAPVPFWDALLLEYDVPA